MLVMSGSAGDTAAGRRRRRSCRAKSSRRRRHHQRHKGRACTTNLPAQLVLEDRTAHLSGHTGLREVLDGAAPSPKAYDKGRACTTNLPAQVHNWCWGTAQPTSVATQRGT